MELSQTVGKIIHLDDRITVVCLVSVWISAHGSPRHRGASQGYRGWGDRRLSR